MKLRVFEAFAGYGSQSIALDLLSHHSPISSLRLSEYRRLTNML